MSKSTTTKLTLVAVTSLFVPVCTSSTVAAESSPKPVAAAATPAPAANPTVSLTKGQSSHFQDALTSLAAQAHIAIVAEGAPLHPQISDTSAPNLITPMPLSQALTILGVAYDYDVQRQEGGVFVLTKRYSDPCDLPCVTLDECQASLKDVIYILDAFSPHFQEPVYSREHDDQRATVVSFFQSLSPAQLAAAQTKTLRYGDLLPDQQTLIAKFILYQFVQMPLDQTQEQRNLLLEAHQAMLVARNKDKVAGAYLEVPDFIGTGKHLTSVTGPITLVDQPSPDWLSLPPASAAMKPLTLAEAVASLQPIDGQQSVVDKPIQTKPISVAGLTNATPMKVLGALETLYGLRISVSDKGAPMLARQAPIIPDKINAVAANVWQALPLSYTRAIDAAAHQKTAQEKLSVSWMSRNEYALYSQEKAHVRKACEETQHEAVRRLRLAMQPYLRQHGPDARIPVSSLTEDIRSALAVVLMSNIVSDLRDTFSGVPAKKALDCLDNINNMIISTVPGEIAYQQGVAIPSLYLQGSPVGSTEEVGMGGIRYFDLH